MSLPEPPAIPSTGLQDATRAELEVLGLLESPVGTNALSLAAALDDAWRYTGAGAAALSKQLFAAMDKAHAMAAQDRRSSEVDEVGARRRRRRSR